MTAAEIIQTMQAAGANPWRREFVLDRDYACPTEEYIQGDFSKWFWAEQHRLGLALFKPEGNDCDNFGLRAMVSFQVAHHLASPNSRVGIAGGLFIYQPKNSPDLHLIFVAIIKGPDGQYRVRFFEPQPQASTFGIVELTQEEIQSCEGYFFC